MPSKRLALLKILTGASAVVAAMLDISLRTGVQIIGGNTPHPGAVPPPVNLTEAALPFREDVTGFGGDVEDYDLLVGAIQHGLNDSLGAAGTALSTATGAWTQVDTLRTQVGALQPAVGSMALSFGMLATGVGLIVCGVEDLFNLNALHLRRIPTQHATREGGDIEFGHRDLRLTTSGATLEMGMLAGHTADTLQVEDDLMPQRRRSPVPEIVVQPASGSDPLTEADREERGRPGSEGITLHLPPETGATSLATVADAGHTVSALCDLDGGSVGDVLDAAAARWQQPDTAAATRGGLLSGLFSHRKQRADTAAPHPSPSSLDIPARRPGVIP